MAEQLADQSSEERAARTAELKRKMQEAAQRNKATAAAPSTTATSSQVQAVAPVETMPVAVASAGVVATPATPTTETVSEAMVSLTPAVHTPSSNGSAPQAVTDEYVIPVEDPAVIARRQMNRREFLTYAWGAALGLVLLESGVALFDFMYPRFKAGEFGGKFFLGPVSSMPAIDAPPKPFTDGKFWLVNTTDEGVKALYMVCTHLGCLYKWEPSTVRFECPCHGSKFTSDGYYIEGPAPRSLDTFVVIEEAGVVVVDTGDKITGSPASESPAKAAA